MIEFTSTMGVNFSKLLSEDTHRFRPLAATQIAGLPVASAKTFSHQGGDPRLHEGGASERKLTLVVGMHQRRAGPAGRRQYPTIGRRDRALHRLSWPGYALANEPLGSLAQRAVQRCPFFRPPGMSPQPSGRRVWISEGHGAAELRVHAGTPTRPRRATVKPDLVGIIQGTCARHAELRGAVSWSTSIRSSRHAQNPKRRVAAPTACSLPDRKQWIHDGNYTYTNILDAMARCSARGAGQDRLRGSGDRCRRVRLADQRRFWMRPSIMPRYSTRNLIYHCKSGKGTPAISRQADFSASCSRCTTRTQSQVDPGQVRALLGRQRRRWQCQIRV